MRYPMCKDQAAQIDCRISDCHYNKGAGRCINESPAITLNKRVPEITNVDSFVCWSREAISAPNIKLNYFHQIIKAILNKGNNHD